jgi:hypothetical protein
VTLLGGGFGRKSKPDYVADASDAMERHVRLVEPFGCQRHGQECGEAPDARQNPCPAHPFKNSLSPEHIAILVAYVRDLAQKKDQ